MVVEYLMIVVSSAGLAVRSDGLCKPPLRILGERRHPAGLIEITHIAKCELCSHSFRNLLGDPLVTDPLGLPPTVVVDEDPPYP